MLTDLHLKQVYRSDVDHILKDFYIPALRESVRYERAVGFFSAGMLSYAAQGLSTFVENEGVMRLIIGGELDADDVSAMEDGYRDRDIANKFGRRFIYAIENVNDPIFYRRLELLSWLIASNRLDIKIALKKRGMYHEKIGVFTDATGGQLVFTGSANETVNALLPDFNFESIAVFPSWVEGLNGYCDAFATGFTNLWENKTPNALVVDFPEAARDKLLRIAKRLPRLLEPSQEIELSEDAGQNRESSPEVSRPVVPALLDGNEFAIKQHQKNALEEWRKNSLNGVMALATGAGKTITAIYGAVKIFEAERKLFVAIAVPYQSLADQWVDVLHKFNIYPIQCYANAERWTGKLAEAISLYENNATDFVCLVVVNKTLQSDTFQTLIQRVTGKRFLWIGDECHHHGSDGLSKCLPQNAEMRLGLSATPEHYFNADATTRVFDYYGRIISTFTLQEALEQGVLTPYRYHVSIVELTEDEATEYLELSVQISKIAAIGQRQADPQNDERLKMFLFRRARLLSKARNKFLKLRELLSGVPPTKLSLFYCGDGSAEDDDAGESLRQVEAVTSILRDNGWRSSLFTSRESRNERSTLLDFFRIGLIDSLVAIRCLDEGIDVPGCKVAYILASSRNPKQFIQRRGRILRRSPGKEFAEIHDFLVTVPEGIAQNSEFERSLLRYELERVAEFAKLSVNHAESIRTLSPLLERYSLSHLIA